MGIALHMVSRSQVLREGAAELYLSVSHSSPTRLPRDSMHAEHKSLQSEKDATPPLKWDRRGKLGTRCRVRSPDMIIPFIVETGIEYRFQVILTYSMLRSRRDPPSFFLAASAATVVHQAGDKAAGAVAKRAMIYIT